MFSSEARFPWSRFTGGIPGTSGCDCWCGGMTSPLYRPWFVQIPNAARPSGLGVPSWRQTPGSGP
eukprot:9503613-Heterocapsa_arctica.AAC.1